jgi:hypothetical protein
MSDTRTPDPSKPISLTLDAAPKGWERYTIQEMVRAASWVVFHADSLGDQVRIDSVEISRTRLQVKVRVPTGLDLALADIPTKLQHLAEVPLAPCPCGCGMDLGVGECVRDELGPTVKEMNSTEKALVVAGDKNGAIRSIRQRTGAPMKDAQELVDGYAPTSKAVR